MTTKYNDPYGKKASTIGAQMRDFVWNKLAVDYIKKDMVFSSMSSNEQLPKHMGRTIKKYKYIPIIDDKNVYPDGMNASGGKVKGNLSGSSRDIATITGTMPSIDEIAGRVNKVGRTREIIESDIHRYGMFMEYTAQSTEFDTESNLRERDRRELAYAANLVYEDLLQIDLINQAGHVIYGGIAAKDAAMSGDNPVPSLINFQTLKQADELMFESDCPEDTTVIEGSSYTDTRVVDRARYMITSKAMVNYFRTLTDDFGNEAWIARQHYAAAGNLIPNEEGTIGAFRIVSNKQMMTAKGAAVGAAAADYRNDGTNYTVHHGLIIGSGAFTTLGFRLSTISGSVYAGNMLFLDTKPQQTVDQPFGDVGVLSVQWYYGTLVERPEWIVCIKSLVPSISGTNPGK